jgi:flagellar biosynthesis protein FliQ
VTDGAVGDLLRATVDAIVAVAGPFVAAAIVVGLVVAVLQAATQIQDSAIAFVPKVLALGVVLLVLGPWVLDRLAQFSERAMRTAAHVGRTAGTAVGKGGK